LYANGLHQCEVIIEVVKEARSADGTWVSSVLTDEERDSVTVVEWATQDNKELVRGWSCDEERNCYDLGLWQRGVSDEVTSSETVEANPVSGTERIYRYLRCDANAPIGPRLFMARMVVEGQVYTTHFSKEGVSFESAIAIDPVRPFDLGVRDLEEYLNASAFVVPGVIVNVSYWTPPAGIRFVINRGFVAPTHLPGDGVDFRTMKSEVFAEGGDVDTYSIKVGTIVNKDTVELPLDINEIHQRLELPVQYPPVEFNKRPTIMRALWVLVKLRFPSRYEQGVWRLLDNFGNEHTFLLDHTQTGIKLTDTLDKRPLRLAHFEITLPSGQPSTTALYANGRHQCKVTTDVIVEREKEDGTWERIRMTDEERDSLTITPYSGNINQPLPAGWHCDKEKNIYDSGLWSRGVEAEVDSNIVKMREGSPPQTDVVDRYMRFDPDRPIDAVKFMARIVVGGVTYTTNYSVGDVSFDSSVTIFPTRPYLLTVSDLVAYVDKQAFEDRHAKVLVSYWSPPAGLRFLRNRGLDAPLSVPDEGFLFQTTYFVSFLGSYSKIGVVQNRDDPSVGIPISAIYSAHPDSNKMVRFTQVSTNMRAVFLRVSSSSNISMDAQSKWRLWDNFGCEHIFRLQVADNEGGVELKNG
jgi:hypothetical protein